MRSYANFWWAVLACPISAVIFCNILRHLLSYFTTAKITFTSSKHINNTIIQFISYAFEPGNNYPLFLGCETSCWLMILIGRRRDNWYKWSYKDVGKLCPNPMTLHPHPYLLSRSLASSTDGCHVIFSCSFAFPFSSTETSGRLWNFKPNCKRETNLFRYEERNNTFLQ